MLVIFDPPKNLERRISIAEVMSGYYIFCFKKEDKYYILVSNCEDGFFSSNNSYRALSLECWEPTVVNTPIKGVRGIKNVLQILFQEGYEIHAFTTPKELFSFLASNS